MGEIYVKDRWTQQVHVECGGELVVVIPLVKKDRMAVACKRCLKLWSDITSKPSDWTEPGILAPVTEIIKG